jgi:sodium bicarbonate cotransporter 8/sodium bicarbonate transporter 10
LLLEHPHEDVALQRTGKWFGGLRADIKRKLPWYFSDFKDALHVQSVASIIYIYLVKNIFLKIDFGKPSILFKWLLSIFGHFSFLIVCSVGMVFAVLSFHLTAH